MKRLSFFLLLVTAIISSACSGGSNGGAEKNLEKIHKNISGIAARGVALPQGSIVELRSSAGYVDIESNVLDESGNMTYDENGDPVTQIETVYKESTIITSSVSDGNGNYTVDITEAAQPFLVRVQDADTGTWYYSYTDGSYTTVNVNPYTDTLIRQWYMGRINADNPANIDIDDVFTSGQLTVYYNGDPVVSMSYSYGNQTATIYYGKPISLPNFDDIEQVRTAITYNVKKIYNVDLQNVLNDTWVVGESYDTLLDSAGFDIDYINRIAFSIYYSADKVYNAFIECDTANKKLKISLWTKYAGSHFYYAYEGAHELTYVSTDSNGIKYYTGEISYTDTPGLMGTFAFDNLSSAEYVASFPVYFN